EWLRSGYNTCQVTAVWQVDQSVVE
ncbi:hypothetical protein A2U01_0111808, partial [Trifolium medium]|nr:hypothetical protein [Trifolium medium]